MKNAYISQNVHSRPRKKKFLNSLNTYFKYAYIIYNNRMWLSIEGMMVGDLNSRQMKEVKCTYVSKHRQIHEKLKSENTMPNHTTCSKVGKARMLHLSHKMKHAKLILY